MKFKYAWPGLLMLAIPVLTSAQISIADFIRATKDELSVQSLKAQHVYLLDKPYRLAPVQKIEFRTGINQIDQQRMEHAVRMSFANPWKLHHTNQYFESYRDVLVLERELVLKDLFIERYRIIVDWVYCQQMERLVRETKENIQKQIEIMRHQHRSEDFKGENYLELQLALIEKTYQWEKIKADKERQSEIIRSMLATEEATAIVWNAKDIISAEQVVELVRKIYQSDTKPCELVYHQKQIELAQYNWKLERSDFNLGFIQTQYQKYRIEQGREPWNISAGLTIPLFNPNRDDITKRKLDIIDADYKYQAARKELTRKQKIAYERIGSLAYQLQSIRKMGSELSLPKLSGALQQLNSGEPSVSIRLQQDLIKLDMAALEIEHDLFKTYLEFLSYCWNEKYSLINYLSPSQDPL